MKDTWEEIYNDTYYLNLDSRKHRYFARHDVYKEGSDLILKAYDRKKSEWVVVDFKPHKWKRITEQEAFIEIL